MIPTPKEKAEELIEKFHKPLDDNDMYGDYIKCKIQCAIIAVDEIINSIRAIYDKSGDGFLVLQINEWQEVKNELLKRQNT